MMSFSTGNLSAPVFLRKPISVFSPTTMVPAFHEEWRGIRVQVHVHMAQSTHFWSLTAQAYNEGKMALAAHYAGSVLREQPDHAQALHLLGVLAWQRGDLEQARDYLE